MHSIFLLLDLKLRPIQVSLDSPSKEFTAAIELKKFDNESNFNKIKGFSSIADILQNIELHDTNDDQDKENETLLLKLQITDSLELNPINLEKLNKICQNKSAVIVIESIVDNESIIYWKLADFEDFFAFKSAKELNSKEVRNLNEFVVNFLADSVQNNHLGKLM